MSVTKTILQCVAVVAVIAFTSTAQAAISAGSRSALSQKDLYELQERCGRRAEEVFRRGWGDGVNVKVNGMTMMASYENHYNIKMNKCLACTTVRLNPEQIQLVGFDEMFEG
jgi:hypothetical protein